jgi:hypothetical protein
MKHLGQISSKLGPKGSQSTASNSNEATSLFKVQKVSTHNSLEYLVWIIWPYFFYVKLQIVVNTSVNNKILNKNQVNKTSWLRDFHNKIAIWSPQLIVSSNNQIVL